MPIPVLSGVGDVLDWYQRNVGDNVSGTILKGLNKAKMGAGLGDQGSQIIDHLNPQQTMDYAYQDNPWGRFLYSTATDPLNLVGLGLPAKLAEVGAVKAIPGAVHLLEGANVLDRAPAAIGGGALDAAGSALKNVAYPMASAAEPYVANFGLAHPALADAWTSTNRLWKELAHDVPGYFLRNQLDDASILTANGEGQSALDAMRGGYSALRGTADPGQVTRDWMDAFHPGGDLSNAITDTGVAASGPESAFRRFQSSHQAYDPTGSYLQTVHDVNHPLDWMLDKVSGYGEKMKGLEQRQEIGTRGPLWGHSAQDVLAPYANDMAMRLDNSGYGGLAADFADRGGMMSPDDLETELRSLGHAGAGDVRTSWENAIGDAERYADNRTNQVLYQYRTDPIGDAARQVESNYGIDLASHGLNPRTASRADIEAISPGTTAGSDWDQAMREARGEQLLRGLAQNTFGGYKFATQNVPALARLSVEHPVIANAPAQYYRDSDYYNALHGLPGSYHGAMPLFKNPLNGDQVFVNPGNMFSFSDVVGAATNHNADSADSPVGELANNLSDVGLGLNPLVRAGLTATGQMGSRQMGDVIRPLTAVSGLAGAALGRPVDLEGPLKGGIADAEQAITGKETFPYQDYLVRKRQAELGGGQSPMAATVTSGPLHSAAQHDEANRLAVEDLVRALGLPDIQMQPREASVIGTNNALQRRLEYTGNSWAARGNPSEHAYDLTDPLQERVARFNELTPIEQQRLMQDPLALEMLSRIRSQMMHGQATLAWR